MSVLDATKYICNKKCSDCVNSWTTCSENGYHSVCLLGSYAALNCVNTQYSSYHQKGCTEEQHS